MEIANKFTLKITFVNLSLQRDGSPGLKVQSEQAEVQHLATQARQSTPYKFVMLASVVVSLT
jgi:hypothetical protein